MQHVSSVAHDAACLLVAAAVAAGCDRGTAVTSIAVDATQQPCMDLRHDEDGDGVGDSCDVCPTVADPAQRDTGEMDSLQFADGVGDACDPRPGRAGDLRVALHTFVADASGLRNTGFTVEGDAARAVGPARLEGVKRHDGAGLVAEVRLTGFAGEVTLLLDGIAGSPTTGAGCTLARDRDADGFDELEIFERGGAARQVALGRTLGDDVTLTAFRTEPGTGEATILCRVREPADREAREERVDLSGELSMGTYLVEVTAATVASSLVVYTTPRPRTQDPSEP